MRNVSIDDTFDRMDGLRDRGSVLEILPDAHLDPRGSFAEILKFERGPLPTLTHWISRPGWIMQVNRSRSVSGVVRGMHAQKHGSCQAKLVEAVNRKIYDIIVDARPDSRTFGVSKVYTLSPAAQNMLFVPRGFLHGFVVPFEYSNENAIFSYYCDNVYDKESEITINPRSFLEKMVDSAQSVLDHDFVSTIREHELMYSDRDVSGMDYVKFMSDAREEFASTGIPWYV